VPTVLLSLCLQPDRLLPCFRRLRFDWVRTPHYATFSNAPSAYGSLDDWRSGSETSTESRDVSSRGVYFFLGKDVKEGSPVEILLTLPNEITLAGPVRVRCLGRIQRTESRDQGAIGVVAAIERYEFLRGDDEKH